MKIFTLNIGSTSTKIALFNGKEKIFEGKVEHDPAQLLSFSSIMDQKELRAEGIRETLEKAGLSLEGCDAIAARCGGTGPILGGTVKQFWSDVKWGDVDFMFVDMPPGTGDVPLTVFQSLPLNGILIVTSPQELVGMIVEKAANMARMMNVPVLGIIENMSYFKCDACGKEHHIFGESHLEEIAGRSDITSIARLPIDPSIAAACDNGNVESLDAPWLNGIADMLEKL